MKVPKGNPFLKETELDFDDITIMVENLKANSFNGYVKFDSQPFTSILFCKEGMITCIAEWSGNNYKMLHEAMLHYKLRNIKPAVSSYILSPEMIDVLGGVYAYQEIYLNYQIRKKEFRRFFETLRQNKYTGIMEIKQLSEPIFLLLNKGTVVTDQFLERYGEAVCGTDSISQLFDTIDTGGGVINTYAEKVDEIERKRRTYQEDLAKVKELIIGVESSLLKGGNAAKIDEIVFREWQRFGEVAQVEIQTASGIIEYAKITAAKNKGMKILVPQALLKKFKINKDETVLVKPIYS